jgi:hypothetical protein
MQCCAPRSMAACLNFCLLETSKYMVLLDTRPSADAAGASRLDTAVFQETVPDHKGSSTKPCKCRSSRFTAARLSPCFSETFKNTVLCSSSPTEHRTA